MSSYVVWANKGGIGKSTMTFQLACAAAHANPNKRVFIFDLSPQCDVSRMVLGGGHFNGEENILEIMQSTPRRTIQSYLLSCLNDVPSGHGWPDPEQFIIEPNQYRKDEAQDLPENLRILCGDFDLERTIQLIEQMPQPPRRTGRAPTGPHYSTYLLTRSFLKNAVVELERRYDCQIFIDTDPYFNVITTQMGLVAAENWITAYSPSSQASQFAVLRSLEFMFEPDAGLTTFINDEAERFNQQWYDNRGHELSAPNISVAAPHLLLSNMANPYRKSGNQRYTDPQRLHLQTIQKMDELTRDEADEYDIGIFRHHEYMWDIRRLGLICDYNGIELLSLQLGHNYSEPGSNRAYHLSATGGTPLQLEGYQRKLREIAQCL